MHVFSNADNMQVYGTIIPSRNEKHVFFDINHPFNQSTAGQSLKSAL